MFSEKQRGKPSHPGKGKGLARKYNRGRQVDTAALNEVKLSSLIAHDKETC